MPPLASPIGERRDLEHAPRRRSERPGRRRGRDGDCGSGMFSRWPVVSASTVSRYSLTASTSQPTSVAIRAMTPASSSQPPKTSPSNSANIPNAPRNGRHDGPGMWTPGGGPSWMTTPAATGTVAPDVVVVDAQTPRPASRAASGPGRSTPEDQDRARRRRGRGTAGTTPTAAKTGANDGPGMWIPAGVLGVIALLAAAGRRGASRRRRNVQIRTTTTRTAISRPGAAPMSAPQSGVTNLRGQLEEAGPDPFEHRSVGSARVGPGRRRSLVR